MENTPTDNERPAARKRLPPIHRLMIAATMLIAAGGTAVTLFISSEVKKNTRQNEVVLERSRHIEAEADLILRQVLPTFTALHLLDVAVTRHVAEFELHVLDFERDAGLLSDSLAALKAAMSTFPTGTKNRASIDRQTLEELVGVFADITEEALEVRSPNKLFQLREDSQDIFVEFRDQLHNARSELRETVRALGNDISRDLRNSRTDLSVQQRMLDALNGVSAWGLSSLVLFVLLVTFLLFRSLHRRLRAVAVYAHRIADGEYSATIDFSSSDRLGEMAESVSHMGSTMAVLVEKSKSQADAAQRAARKVKRLAYYDALTGLPNRQQFMEKLASAIENAAKRDERVAVVYLDLDKFKKVNDSYGHSVGDKLLCAVADRLTHNVRSDDVFACRITNPPVVLPSRLGGDEFTFLINRIHDREEAETIVNRILHTLDKPYHLAGKEVFVTPSMGVAMFPEDGDTVEELMKNSDMAMYQAKENGRNNVKFFNVELGERQIRRLDLERDLSKALERGEFTIHYQAKVDLETRTILGAEALLRWNHPEQGVVPPLEFISLAEETGLIIPIGNWVLHHVCHQLARWQSADVEPVPIAVNVSARQFARGDLASVVKDCVKTADVCEGNIELELTESILMNDTELAVDVLTQLAEADVKVSLDDFGTGYSSLGYLKRFPLSAIKIDRSFVRDITTDIEDATIVKAILALSHSLGLGVIAEGVENDLQVGFLRKNGCKEAQGFLFSKPLPAEEFAKLLSRKTTVSVA